jgi:opacity protein-like surface antigen
MKFTSAAKMVAMGTAATVGVTSAASANSDVEGLYAGFGLNGWNGGIGDDTDPLYRYGITRNIASAFAGYNFVNGNNVYGVELAATGASGAAAYTGFGHLIDVKGRVGRTFGSVLAYASAGFSFGNVLWPDASAPWKTSGFNIGVGAEAMVTDHMFLGADVTTRFLNTPLPIGYWGGPGGNKTRYDPITSVTIRAGWRF